MEVLCIKLNLLLKVYILSRDSKNDYHLGDDTI